MATLTYPYINRYTLYTIWHPNWHFSETSLYPDLNHIFALKKSRPKVKVVLKTLMFVQLYLTIAIRL